MKSGTSGSAPHSQWRRWLNLALVGLSLVAGAAWADPPGRVGRIADIEGHVWLFDGESNEWVAALRNRPLTAGDRISTDADGRSVLRIGPTSVMVDAQTELEVLQLDDAHVSFQLHDGSMALRLRTRETALEYQVLTREGSFNPERAGHYRIDRRDDISYASVWSGELRHESGASVMSLRAGQRGEFLGDAYAQDRLIAPERDAFSDWVMAQEAREQRSVSERYVSPEMTGAEDLDRYGRWDESPEYGPVWIPLQVEAGWAPYRQGRWVSIMPWGWTWVDDAPWGFAPFHYGRWARYREHWCWVPGSYVQRPVYAPALVAWVGGPQLSVSVTIGSRPPPMVGWFPLAPREVYVPSYRVSHRYARDLNVSQVPDGAFVDRALESPRRPPHEFYRNRDVRGAVTVVPVSSIGRGRPIERIADPGTIQQLTQTQVHIDPGLPAPAPEPQRYQPRRPDRNLPERVMPGGRRVQVEANETGRAVIAPSQAAPGWVRPGQVPEPRGPVTLPPARQAAPAQPAPGWDHPGQESVPRDYRGREAGREGVPQAPRPDTVDRISRRERVNPPVAMPEREPAPAAPAMRLPGPQQGQAPSVQRAEPARDAGPRRAPPEVRMPERDETPAKREDRRDIRRPARTNLE